MKQIIEVLIAKNSKFAKNGYNFLDNRSTTFGIFLQTYLRFSEVVFFTCYHQQIENRDCLLPFELDFLFAFIYADV